MIPSRKRCNGLSIHHRRRLATGFAAVGLILFNWWIIATIVNWDRFTHSAYYSDFEALDQPYAAVYRACDVCAGFLLSYAIVVRGRTAIARRRRHYIDDVALRRQPRSFSLPFFGRVSSRVPFRHRVRAEGIALFIFGIGTILAGLMPFSCAEGLDPTCGEELFAFSFPWYHYGHSSASLIEFLAPAAALYFMQRRHCGRSSGSPQIWDWNIARVWRDQQRFGDRPVGGHKHSISPQAAASLRWIWYFTPWLFLAMSTAYLSGLWSIGFEIVFFVSWTWTIWIYITER